MSKFREKNEQNLLDQTHWHYYSCKTAVGTSAAAIAPLPVSIVAGCQRTPCSFAVSSCAAVITTAFVDEREHATVASS